MMQITQRMFVVVSAILGAFVIGVALGSTNVRMADISGTISGNGDYQAGWDAAKKRLAESSFLPMMMGNAEIKSVSGEVKTVDGGKITLKIRPLEPLADPKLDIRTVMIGEGVKIYQMEQRDPALFQKEMEAFNKAMQERIKNPSATSSMPAMPPEMYAKKEIKIDAIKTGQQLTVSAGENIKDAREIKAAEITMQSGQNAPAAVMPPVLSAPAL